MIYIINVMIVNRCLGTHTTMLDIFIYETGTNGGIDHTCWEDLTQGMFDAPSLPQIHISLQLRELRETAANTRDMGCLWYSTPLASKVHCSINGLENSSSSEYSQVQQLFGIAVGLFAVGVGLFLVRGGLFSSPTLT